MTLVRTIADCRAAIAQSVVAVGHGVGNGVGRCVALVPTMGAFHEGHLALMRRARDECDVVAVSVFVNPLQFEDLRDLANYPRDLAGDMELATGVGVDVVFAPRIGEMYPIGFATSVNVDGPIVERLEGAVRGAGHFRGVATVVTKLLNVVRPSRAYFGEKDAQQLAVVRQLVRDLDLDIGIVAVPTVREPDGLALSSRNVRLGAVERRRAASLHAALQAVRAAARAGERCISRLVEIGRHVLDADSVDYFEIVDATSFEAVERLEVTCRTLVAARIGGVRLIDNVALHPPDATMT